MKKKITQRLFSIILCITLLLSSINLPEIFDNNLNAATTSWSFGYTGSVQTFTAPYTGRYDFTLYGGSGAGAGSHGGYAGYANGSYNMKAGETIYIQVAGAGTYSAGGYNGGGSPSAGGGGGGGATSIAQVNGLLSSLSASRDNILFVAGGGAGAGTNMIDWPRIQGNGGGSTGTSSTVYRYTVPYPSWVVTASQTSGYAFGQGGPGSNGGGAGGGGFFGGVGIPTSSGGGFGGSGHISEKVYNANTKTSTHIGNGSVSINYVGEVTSTVTIKLLNGATIDGNNVVTYTGSAGSTKTLNISNKSGYTLLGYGYQFGDAKITGNTLTFGFNDTTITAQYSAQIQLTSSQNNNKVNLNYYQDDNFNKLYRAYQSLDGVNWYLLDSANEGSSSANKSVRFNYLAQVQSFTAPVDGDYTLHLYGARGGYSLNQGSWYAGYGYGGYTTGIITLKEGQTIYIATGGAGSNANLSGWAYGGWNGGGNGSNDGGGGGTSHDDEGSGGGGGATSVTWVNRGVLANFNSYRNEVIAVAGGGGGSSYDYGAGAGGGLTGGADGSGAVANQTSGYAFGQGQHGSGTGDSDGVGGGGGGWYGGYTKSSSFHTQGGGGSGYIGGLKTGTSYAGKNNGNGYVDIQYVDTTFSSTSINNITLKDTTAPNKPSSLTMLQNGNNINLTWNVPTDNGTTYYHRVTSYNADTNAKMYDSVAVENSYTSGIKGYYYYIDNSASGTVTKSHTYSASNNINITKPTTTSYIHIASVDNAGNISGTYTYNLLSVYKYTVNHHLQNVDNPFEYTLDTTEVMYGENNKVVTPDTKEYYGYFTPDKQSITITSDGSAVVDYYYDRIVCSLETIVKIDGVVQPESFKNVLFNITLNNTNVASNSNKYANMNVTYGSTYSLTTTNVKGYSIKSIENQSGTITEGIVITINLTPNKYTLTVNPNGGTWNGSTSNSTFTMNYNTTKSIPIPIAPSGYVFTGWTLTGTDAKMTSLTKESVFTIGTSNATLKANYVLNEFDVTYIDVIDSENGKELNKIVKIKYYGDVVNGTDIGSDKSDNAYYKGYYLYNTTSTTVGLGNNTVYRIFKLRTIDINGSVNWNDKSNAYGSRQENVTITLFRNGTKIDTFTGLTDKDNNTFSFKELPKYDTSTGEAYVYTVSQSDVVSNHNPEEKYNTTVDATGFNFVNTLTNSTKPDDETKPPEWVGFEVSGSIIWKDFEDKFGNRPSEIELTLYQNNVAIKTQVVDKNATGYSFVNLDKYDSELNPYTYKVEENFSSKVMTWNSSTKQYEEIDAYTITANGFDFTNKLVDTKEKPVISVKPDHINNLTIKLNFNKNIDWINIEKTSSQVTSFVTLKQMETLINNGTVSYTSNYNGMEYNAIVNESGVTINNIPSGKYEIVESNDNTFILEGINLQTNSSISVVNENNKWYLIIAETNQNQTGTVILNMNTDSFDGYDSVYNIKGLYKTNNLQTAQVMMLSMFSDEVTVPEYVEPITYTITYKDSDVVDDNKYSENSEATLKDCEIEGFLGWSEDSEATEPQYIAGDKVKLEKDLILYPVIETSEQSSEETTEEEVSEEEATSEIEESSETKETTEETIEEEASEEESSSEIEESEENNNSVENSEELSDNQETQNDNIEKEKLSSIEEEIQDSTFNK